VKRWPFYLAGTLVVVLAAGGTWLALRPGDDEPKAASCPYPVVPSSPFTGVPRGGVTTSIPAPSGGAVTVTETGFTQSGDRARVSIGAVAENTSSQVAYHTRVIFRAYTAKGTSAIAESEQYTFFFEIPIIRPEERVAIGDFVNVDPTTWQKTGIWLTVARAGLDLVNTQWIPAENTASFPTVSARLDPTKPPQASDGWMSVNFAASSNACRELGSRGVGMVFRNAGGAVIGGAVDGDDQTDLCKAGEFKSGATAFNKKLPNVDLARTEVSVFCDVTGSSFLKPGPTQPSN
jgi:hypothetical protein